MLDDPKKERKLHGPKRTLARWLKKDDAHRRAVSPSFRGDPVSYIVALADQLQDFGRMHYTPLPASAADLSHSTVRSCYPCQLVEVTAEGSTGKLRADITFDYLGAPPFDASANDLGKAAAYKKAQERLLFDAGGWLRSDGLFEKVTLRARTVPAVAPAPPPSPSDAAPSSPPRSPTGSPPAKSP